MVEEKHKLMKLRIESPQGMAGLTKIFLDDVPIIGVTDLDFKIPPTGRALITIKMFVDDLLIKCCPETLQFIQELKSKDLSTIYKDQHISFLIEEEGKKLEDFLQRLESTKKSIESLEKWHQTIKSHCSDCGKTLATKE